MTEEEAKKLWCPFAASRAVSVQTGPATLKAAYLRNQQEDKLSIFCVGSLCMAWRLGDPTPNRYGGFTSSGYCGLAGKP
jgi:hypothetical protein